MELRDTVVVITGASSGIGEATAVAFAKRGARVVLVARRIDRLEALAERIERAGGRALAWKGDVTDTAQLEKLPGLVKELTGRPADVLINNAGVPGGGDFTALSHDEIETIVRVNLLGVLHATRAFLPGMIKRGHGHIVNVASLAGRFAPPGAAVYTATKHAVVGADAISASSSRGRLCAPGGRPTGTAAGSGRGTPGTAPASGGPSTPARCPPARP